MNVLRSTVLDRCADVTHAFFTRHGGVSDGIYDSLNCGLGSQDQPHRVHENLKRVAGHLDLEPAQLITLRQTHSTTVTVIADTPPAERLQADALVTASPGIALGITGADCPTVLLADAAARVVGAAHAGWRGALNGVLEATLARMIDLGARQDAVVASIGPGIQQTSYEVGQEFHTAFVAREPDAARHFDAAGGTLRFDLPGYIHGRLLRAGLREVELLEHDTFTSGDLFSYRRSRKQGEPDYGRQLGVVVLRKAGR